MVQFLPEFLTVAGVHLLAVMSPGPDFILISRNSLVYSRRVAVASAAGLALGILVHVIYSLIGIGLIISRSVAVFSILKFIGAGYLIYIGYRSLRATPHSASTSNRPVLPPGTLAALRTGFFTNVLNPKVTLFFFALFTQVIDPQTPVTIQAFYGLEMSVMTFVWFAFVATVLSHTTIKQRFISVQRRLEKVFGVILIALGIKVAATSR